METNPAEVRGIKAEPVSQWLTANIDGATGPFTFTLITGGHSNLTYRVTAADGRQMVLRRPPLGAVLATAHDMGREHKIVSGVGRSTVPVPAALGFCDDVSVNDAPFYIMDYVEGVVPHDADTVAETMADTTTRQRLSQSVVDVLAALHTVDPDTVGLGDLGRKEAYLDRQLRRWNKQWEASKTRELPQMDRAFELLSHDKPEQRYTGIVHGDYRLGNMLVDPVAGSVAAVLDWELCTLGDVLADVGYLLNNWIQPDEETIGEVSVSPTRVGGFTTREELVAAYAAATGFEVSETDANYYRAFQYWRLGAIVEGVLARYEQGVMADESVDPNDYRLRVVAMADASLELLESS